MMLPIVSIIVPCFKQAQYLPETLQSVLDQTYTNWECIIVNDGSPDATEVVALEWCKKDHRFIYLKKENGGLSSARNAGLKIAKGDYIQFLDSDDLMEKNKILQQSTYFDSNIDVIISGYRYFEDKEGISSLRIIGRNGLIPETAIICRDIVDVIDLFNEKNPFVICAPLYKKEIFNIVGLFDEELTSLEDWDFNLRCALKKVVFHHSGYADDAKVLVRLHNTSMMCNNDRMNENVMKFREKHILNPEYVAYFGVSKKSKITLKQKINTIIYSCIPPILILLKNKLFKK